MQCYSLFYQNRQKLVEFIANNAIDTSATILVQVFTGINEYEYIKNLRDILLEVLPQAKIVGATTSGEISQDKVGDGSTVISISVFEKTQLLTSALLFEENSFD